MSPLDSPLNLEILDHLPQGMFIVRWDGIVVFWNHCLEDWTNILKSTIVGTSLENHFPHLGTPKYTSRFEPLFEGGAPATFASQFHPQFLPCFLQSGQPRIQQTVAKAIWDEPTQAWQALVIIQDISDLHRQVAESQRLRKQAQAEMAERKESERALQESETRLDLAINGTHDGIWDWMDVTQDEEWWSPRFYELLGYTVGEISPSLSSFKSLLHPDDLEGTVAAVQNHLEQHHPFDIKYRLRTKAGVYRWFRAKGSAIRNESGCPTRMAGSIQDITESQEHERELQLLSERLVLATASAKIGIWDWDISCNNLTWDQRMLELYGLCPDQFSGAYEAWTQGLHPNDRSQAEQSLQRALDGTEEFNTEFRVVWPDKSIHVVAAYGLVQRDSQGQPLRMIGVNWDITIQKSEQENRAHLQSAIDQSVEGVALLDQNGRYTYINRAHAAMYGYTVDELLGQSWKMLYSKDQVAFIDSHCLSHLRDLGEWQGELIGLRKNGTSFPVEISLSLLLQKDKKSAGLVCSCRDMTERKRAEERFRQAVESAPSGMIMIDSQGQIVLTNQAISQLFGYEPGELIGASIEQLVPDRFKTRHPEHRSQFFSNPHPRRMGGGRDLFGLHKNGSEVPIEIGLNPLKTEEGTFVLASVVDITARKLEEERFRLVVETTPNGMIMIDKSGRIVLVNQLTESLFGFSRTELIGQPIELLIPARFRKDHPHHRSEYTSTANPHSVMGKGRELWGMHKDGREIPIEVGLNPIETTEGRFILSSIVDITERKAAEEQIQKNAQDLEHKNKELVITRDQALAAARSKSEFLATMSHEIRTPLNGVIGMTDLLLGTGLDSDQHEMLETVKHSGEFLLTLINDILDFSKIDAGKLDLEIIDFDVRTAVDEVLDILAERASQNHLELIGLVYATTPLQLRGDPGRIRQILFNLIGNAIKFTQEGEIVVDVSVIETVTDATTLRFAVTDTGMGIAHEIQQRLFESFTQADSSTTRKFGGTGLGLAICKQLVTLMQGEIGVVSEKGQGSTFWFSIPFAQSSISAPTKFFNADLQGRRVCIVESNDTIRFLLQHYTQSWGMICEVAQNGNEGLALLRQRAKGNQSFDIALLDHTLSETIQEDGLSLAKRIRQDSQISHVPLILLTALGKRGEGKLAQDAGFNGYLTKPIRHKQLQQSLQMILGSNQQTLSTPNSHSSPLITRHTVEAAQAQTEVHILLAEDNVVNQKVAVRMIKKMGYRVDVVENGQKAIEAIGRTSYDLVLMDCQMPEMDGLEATRRIREEKNGNGEAEERVASDALPPALQESYRLPIIALTANALPGDRETCFEAGMDDFMTKPVRIEELREMISKWLPRPAENNSVDQHISEKTRKGSTTLPSPCLDVTILENLKALGGDEDPEFLLTVIDQFLLDLPRHLEGIQQAVERQDAEALVKTAHACKGSSRSIGATLLAEISYALELMGREGRMANTTRKLEQWLQEKERTTHALQHEREQFTSSAPTTPLA